MNRFLFAVESVTYAHKGRDLLRKHGISANIERISNVKSSHGCGFGIEAVGDLAWCASLLKENGIRVLYAEVGGAVVDLS